MPLNHALDTASSDTAQQHAGARLTFETAWSRWNLVRTLTSIGALAAFAAAPPVSS